MQVTIGDIASEATVVAPYAKCEEAYTLFNDSSALDGLVVCTNNQPIGLIMKTQFYQKLSTKYGFDLFMKRTVELVMNQTPLIVDYSEPIAEVSAKAMNRVHDHVYDCVIVTKDEEMYGVVSIKQLLIKLAEVQVRIAQFSNPLTGLPGNYAIEETLQEVLKYENFSVLYIDIDSFKVFNDTYGFREGDEVIRETAKIISDTIITPINEPCFVGHIGGDDFIAVIPNYQHEKICEKIITKFNNFITGFYSEDELSSGYIEAINRKGELENMPLVSLSIAVVQNKSVHFSSVQDLSKEAAKLKKQCKAINKSVYLTLEDAFGKQYCP